MAAPLQHLPPVAGCHARPETMRPRSFNAARLIGAFHPVCPRWSYAATHVVPLRSTRTPVRRSLLLTSTPPQPRTDFARSAAVNRVRDDRPQPSDFTRKRIDFPTLFCYHTAFTGPLLQGESLLPSPFTGGMGQVWDMDAADCLEEKYPIELQARFPFIHICG